MSEPGTGARRWTRWLERAAAVVVLAFLGGYVARHWSEVAGHPWRIDGSRLALATACVLVAYSGFVLVWRRTLHSLGGRLSIRDAHRIWYIANLGRYVPGKVLQLAGTAYLARAKGVSPVLSVSASLIAQALLLVAGLAVAAAALPELGAGAGLGVSWPVGLGIAAGLALFVLTPALDAAYRLALRLIGRSEYYEALPFREKLLLLLADLATWIVLGVGFWLFVRAVAPVGVDALLPLIGICAAGYVGGYLAVFVPGGLGVREGLYALMLGTFVTPSVAVAIAVLARLWLTASELVPLALLVGRYGLTDLRAGAPDPEPRPAHG